MGFKEFKKLEVGNIPVLLGIIGRVRWLGRIFIILAHDPNMRGLIRLEKRRKRRLARKRKRRSHQKKQQQFHDVGISNAALIFVKGFFRIFFDASLRTKYPQVNLPAPHGQQDIPHMMFFISTHGAISKASRE